MNKQDRKSSSYKDAGVDTDKADEIVKSIKNLTNNSHSSVLSGVGGFASVSEIPKKYKDPVILSATDGVGTKILLAKDSGIHENIGIDLVAMSTNDIVAQGGCPAFFLDYFGTGSLDQEVTLKVLSGIVRGCKELNIPLIGGETSEMPGFYPVGAYELVGFAVGFAERDLLQSPEKIEEGDLVIGVSSSGPHSNGFSLIRKILQDNSIDYYKKLDGARIIDLLMKPTIVYSAPFIEMMNNRKMKRISHITGGGIINNLERILPKEASAIIDVSTWQMPAIFEFLQDQGDLTANEMHRVFNCGIGFAVVLSASKRDEVVKVITATGLNCNEIGVIETRVSSAAVVFK